MGTNWATRPRWRVRGGEEIALGPGKADLLQAIDERHSISEAARRLGMSYRRAWSLVDTMNRCFRRPLVETAAWRGGGSSLTPAGRRVLELYRRIEAESLRATREDRRRLHRLLGPA